MDEPDDLAKAAILQWLNEQYTEKPDYWYLAPEVHIALEKELEKYGYDTIERTIGLVQIMAEEGQLREKNRGYQITNKGRNDLNTIYNDDWIVSKMHEHANKQKKEKEKQLVQFNLDERRHSEVVEAARAGNKIQWVSIWIAMGLGALGLIIAVLKP